MFAARLVLAALALVPLAQAVAPAYSLASVVNTATGVAGDFAPNGMVSIYGTNLSYGTESAPGGSGVLPRTLAGVTVVAGGLLANLYYVSPQQINILIPSLLLPGPVTFYILREGVAGPILNIVLKEAAPGFFAAGNGNVIATHADGSLITADSPAAAEEVIVAYAAGLGRTSPDADPGRPASRAAPIMLFKQLSILLGGTAIDSARILYAGITPGFAGLYQINFRVPVTAAADPEVRVFIGLQGSPSYLKLPVRVQ